MREKMISRKQYIRLTMVIIIPILLFGWWLAENEKILPLHNVIYCQESGSDISCYSVSVKKSDANIALYQNAAVRLWGARLESGFHHPIITLGHSEINFVDGKSISLPPTDGEKNKYLSLPPKSIQGNALASCEITPYAHSEKNWLYSCIGSDLEPDGFYFKDDNTSQKFNRAKNIIEEQKKNNDEMNFRGLIVTVLIPLILYFGLSLVIFLLTKIVRYVIHGRAGKSSVG